MKIYDSFQLCFVKEISRVTKIGATPIKNSILYKKPLLQIFTKYDYFLINTSKVKKGQISPVLNGPNIYIIKFFIFIHFLLV